MIHKRNCTQQEEFSQEKEPGLSNYRLKFFISNRGCNQWKIEHLLPGNLFMCSEASSMVIYNSQFRQTKMMKQSSYYYEDILGNCILRVALKACTTSKDAVLLH
uniref:Uncharacterized protein LOC101494304 isoform X2 n=1 Tax=Cicer arietinum TaxID=3827 RepID=A0A1S3E1F6_CICAR|nr:uncharacterized protein LOC101494304 isoform X2 [Cicer arietinum]